MRLTSDIFVSALMRRVFAAGGFAAIGRRGAEQAGAIFVLLRGRDGRLTLFGPAPQSAYEDAHPGERAFAVLAEDADQQSVDARLSREGRYDPDYWLVEIEPGGVAVDRLIEIVRMP